MFAMLLTLVIPSIGSATDSSAGTMMEQGVEFTLFYGEASIKKAGTDQWIPLKDGTIIKLSDEIKTNKLCKAELTWLKDNTILRVKPNAQMKFYTNSLEISKGNAWFRVTKRNSRFEVLTPTAVAGVRGTVFEVGVNPSTLSTTVSVYEGKVEVSKLTTQQNKSVRGQSLILKKAQELSCNVRDFPKRASVFSIKSRMRDWKDNSWNKSERAIDVQEDSTQSVLETKDSETSFNNSIRNLPYDEQMKLIQQRQQIQNSETTLPNTNQFQNKNTKSLKENNNKSKINIDNLKINQSKQKLRNIRSSGSQKNTEQTTTQNQINSQDESMIDKLKYLRGININNQSSDSNGDTDKSIPGTQTDLFQNNSRFATPKDAEDYQRLQLQQQQLLNQQKISSQLSQQTKTSNQTNTTSDLTTSSQNITGTKLINNLVTPQNTNAGTTDLTNLEKLMLLRNKTQTNTQPSDTQKLLLLKQKLNNSGTTTTRFPKIINPTTKTGSRTD